jgi:tetratricopeptide (TPR) repeat protein
MTGNKTYSRLRLMAAATLVGLMLAGCQTKKAEVASASSKAPVEDETWAGRAGVKDAIALLNEGKPDEARRHLIKVLEAQPGDAIARRLVTQIDSDPKVLLGARNYSYKLKEGDSLSSLAQRHLGDPMMFYALARYNDITVPTAVTPGQSILIPGKKLAAPKTAKKEPKAEPAEKKQPATAAAKPAPATPAPKAQPQRVAAANPAQAARLRGQGLAALNNGAIDRAVALFRQALNFDPASALIKADLGRALRIQSTVRAR